MIESAAIIALLSLYVSLRVAWDTRFKPAQVVAFFSSFSVWKFSHKNHDEALPIVVPNIVLSNIGARPAVVEDIRLGFTVPGHGPLWAHPDMSVPSEAMEQPGSFLVDSSSSDDYSRMVLGHPFSGFVLPAGAQASVDFHFHLPSTNRSTLSGPVTVCLDIWIRDKGRWTSLMTDVFDFSEDPFAPMPKTQTNSTRYMLFPACSRKQRRGSCAF